MRKIYLAICFVLLALLTWISLNTGVAKLENVFSLILGKGSQEDLAILHLIRIPRVIAAIVVGASLGIAGALSQGILRNPLAEPILLGTTGGASIATLIALLSFNVTIGSPLAIAAGIVGALLATLIVFQLGKRSKDTYFLIVIGIAASSLLTAVVALATLIVDKPQARGVSFWSLGTLSMATPSQVLTITPFAIAAWIFSWWISNRLDFIALGEIRARHLGIDISRTRLFVFIGISISIGAITSVFGQIAFLALAAPHIARGLFGVRHRQLVIYSGLIGAITLSAADLAARSITSPNELPLGLLTALIGAPVLIFVARRREISHA